MESLIVRSQCHR